MQSAYVGIPRFETSFMFSCMATHLLSSTMHSTLQDALASGTSRTEIRFSGLCHVGEASESRSLNDTSTGHHLTM